MTGLAEFIASLEGKEFKLEPWQRRFVEDAVNGTTLQMRSGIEVKRAGQAYAVSVWLAWLYVQGFEIELQGQKIVCTRPGEPVQAVWTPSEESAASLFAAMCSRLEQLRELENRPPPASQ